MPIMLVPFQLANYMCAANGDIEMDLLTCLIFFSIDFLDRRVGDSR